jgi:hypothetical protein
MRPGFPPVDDCFNGLFDAFEFTRFQDAEPPRRKGVYVIWVHRRGTPIGEVHDRAIGLAGSISWDIAGRFLRSRLDRLLTIGDCCQRRSKIPQFRRCKIPTRVGKSRPTLTVVPDRKMFRIFRGLHAPGNMTDEYRVDPGGYQPDFIGERRTTVPVVKAVLPAQF